MARSAPVPRCGPYELLERIGTGGMAEVFRARYRGAAGAEREVVLKRLLPFPDHERGEIERLFVAEARLTLKLTHGNVVQVFDFGEDHGQYYLAMEWVDGVSLGAVLKRARAGGLLRLPPALAALVLIEVAKGLHYAHTRVDAAGKPLQVVHRDVSPDNIFLSRDGQVKVGDFGIARASVTGRDRTEPGVFRGKLEYASPEQMRGEPVDARADVYAAGIVLWRLLTGENPQAPLGLKLAAGVATLPEPPIDVTGPELGRILREATAADPARRLPSAQELQRRLQAFLKTEEVPHPDTAVAQLLTWLGVGTAPEEPVFTEWLGQSVRAARESAPGPMEANAPAPEQPKAPPHRRDLSRVLLGAAVAAVFLAGAAVVVTQLSEAETGETRHAPPDEPKPLELKAPAARAEPKAPAPAVERPEPDGAAAALPMSATGVPARFVLASSRHGVEVSQLGTAVHAPAPNWGLRLSGDGVPLLYYWATGEEASALKLVGKSWQRMGGDGGRLFALAPKRWQAGGARVTLELARWEPNGPHPLPEKSVPRVLTEALSYAEDHRFHLTGLRNGQRYRVVSREVGSSIGAPVVVVLFEANRPAAQYDVLSPGFAGVGPPRQRLLMPGGELEFWGAEGIDAVMLTRPGGGARRVELSVEQVRAVVIERGSAEAQALTPRAPGSSFGSPPGRAQRDPLEPQDGMSLLDTGTMQMIAQKYDAAAASFRRCLELEPGNEECSRMLKVVQAKAKH